ncbi:MAG: thioredoxin family protein [Chitinophagales bacterium]
MYLPLALLFFCSLEAQPSKVNWISFEEAFAKIETKPKPILIDFYTSWCGWCKTMMKTTYSNEEVAAYINENFYAVKFDAEGKDTINYFGKEYVSQQRTHQLAIKLLGKQQRYPSTLFVDPNTKFSLLVPSYIKPKQMPPFLIYMVENMFRSTPYPKFEKFYKLSKKAIDSTAMAEKPSINWLSTKDAMKKFKKKPKKLLFNFYTDACEGCKIMDKTTFTHPAIVEYVNENFYAVNFDASSDENIQFLSQKLKGASANKTPFHEFFMTLTDNKPMLPTLILMTEEPKLLLNLPFYRTPGELKSLLKYYGDDLQNEMTWEEYKKKKAN